MCPPPTATPNTHVTAQHTTNNTTKQTKKQKTIIRAKYVGFKNLYVSKVRKEMVFKTNTYLLSIEK